MVGPASRRSSPQTGGTPVPPSEAMSPPLPRTHWAAFTDAQLLARCEVDTYRASGPGGQKRNKTSSAIRIRHAPTGLIVIASESRSQHENRARALRRLRQAIALTQRGPIDEDAAPPAFLADAL